MKPLFASLSRWVSVALIFAALIGSGCATVQDDTDFDVTLVKVDSTHGAEGEVEFVFTVRLQNATPDPVVIRGAAHKIYLDGVYIGQGLNGDTIEVPRLGTVTQQVTVHLSTFRLARAAFRIYSSHQVAYKINSTLYGSGSSRTRRLSKEGAVDLDQVEGLKSKVESR
jgi:LEA14-like dessication related protein